MTGAEIDFAALPWEESPASVGVRFKRVVRAGRRVRLVEFTKLFVEHDWCVKGHIGYVIEGEIEIAFDDRRERLTAGDGIFIEGGEAKRHKARAICPLVRLLLVEDD